MRWNNHLKTLLKRGRGNRKTDREDKDKDKFNLNDALIKEFRATKTFIYGYGHTIIKDREGNTRACKNNGGR